MPTWICTVGKEAYESTKDVQQINQTNILIQCSLCSSLGSHLCVVWGPAVEKCCFKKRAPVENTDVIIGYLKKKSKQQKNNLSL